MRTEVTVREARKDELPLIKKLSVEELPDELNEIERKDAGRAKRVFAERMDDQLRVGGNEIYVAMVDGSAEIAGYVWFGVAERPFSDMKVGWVYDLFVVPGHRGRGVGEALLRRALDVSRKRGFELTGLMVRANNKVAYSLYEKLGFKGEYVVMTRDQPGDSASNS